MNPFTVSIFRAQFYLNEYKSIVINLPNSVWADLSSFFLPSSH